MLRADGLYANLWRVQVGDIESLAREFLERTSRRQAVVDTDDDED